jgi:hypothetical protein
MKQNVLASAGAMSLPIIHQQAPKQAATAVFALG